MFIKSKILNSFEYFLKKNIDDLTKDDLEIALYGMEVIYSLITKLILFFIISIMLNCYKEFLIVYLILGILRSTSFGFHAEKEISCYITSFFIIFGTIYISKYIVINTIFKTIICILSIFTTTLYAPADTEKRPLLNRNIRSILKFCSLITVIFYSFTCLVSNGFMSNTILCILIVNSINISPLLYKIFKRRYKNYEYYEKRLSK